MQHLVLYSRFFLGFVCLKKEFRSYVFLFLILKINRFCLCWLTIKTLINLRNVYNHLFVISSTLMSDYHSYQFSCDLTTRLIRDHRR